MADITGSDNNVYTNALGITGNHPSQLEIYLNANGSNEVMNNELTKADNGGQPPYAVLNTIEQSMAKRSISGNETLSEPKMSGLASLPFQKKNIRADNANGMYKILVENSRIRAMRTPKLQPPY